MISGGVSFDGDPAKAKAALVEALHCAHIVRATKSRLGLRDLTKQFDLAGGGVVWITDNEFVHHIYIDVRDKPVRPSTTEDLRTEEGLYSINPVALFASADFPNGIKPEVPATSTTPKEPAVPAGYDATPSGSLWKNPPFVDGKDLKFKHGTYKLSDPTDPANAFPGILDWSDRRPLGEAEHYGIVLSWWPAPYSRGVRYAIPSYYYASWEDPSPTRLQDLYYGQPFLDQLGDDTLGLIWANGVPVVQTGFTEIYAAFLKTEVVNNNKKSFLWVATADFDDGIYLRKYEFPSVVKKGMPVLAPADFVESKLISRPTAPVGELPANSSYSNFSYFDLYFLTANSSGTKLLALLYESYTSGTYPFPLYNTNNYPWGFYIHKLVEIDVETEVLTCVKRFPEPNRPQTDIGNLTVTRKNIEYIYSAAYWKSVPAPPNLPPPPFSYVYDTWQIGPSSGYYNMDVDADVPAFVYYTTWTYIYAIDYVVDTPTYVYGVERRARNRFLEGRISERSTSSTSGGGNKVYVATSYTSGYTQYDNYVQNYTTGGSTTWTQTETYDGPTEISLFSVLGATETLLHQESKGSVRTVQQTGSWLYSRSYSGTTNGPADTTTNTGTWSTNIQYDISTSENGTSAYPEIFLVASDLRVGFIAFDILWDSYSKSGTSFSDSRTYADTGSSSSVNNANYTNTSSSAYTTSYQSFSTDYSSTMRRVSTHASFALPERLIEQYSTAPYSATSTLTNDDIPYGAYYFMENPFIRFYPGGASGYYWPPYINHYFIRVSTSGVEPYTTGPQFQPDWYDVVRGVLFSQNYLYPFPDCFAASGATSSFDGKLVFAWAVTRVPYNLAEDIYDLTPDNTQLVSKLFLASAPNISVDLTNPAFHPLGFNGPGLTEKLQGATQFLLLGPVRDDEGTLQKEPTTLSSD